MSISGIPGSSYIDRNYFSSGSTRPAAPKAEASSTSNEESAESKSSHNGSVDVEA
ncbi:MAG: hypothetical protein K2X66_16215 [Cyanobacteria bacterium]|nr:hypothetical protein [Cyanobacteriota bacterium]